jgi:CO/xanthine dehydrogenase Mo-binding subunit/CO/xanthine dehydrogenase FAD-binding subunit
VTLIDRPTGRTAESPIGQRIRNIDWDSKTSGAADYTGDVRLPGMLHARIVRSSFPHARLLGVDLSDAAQLPGVVATVTAADFADARYVHHGGPLADRAVLASDRVRYVGEEIAGVAAETLTIADEAVRRTQVRYEPLPYVTDVDAARADGAPLLHDSCGRNVSVAIQRRWGDTERRPADVRVEGTYRFGRQTHACMEPNSVVASWDGTRQHLEVWISTQAPYLIRKELAGVLGLEPEQVELHEIAVGGGFGSKSKISEFEAVACKLSMKAGRPVRLVLTREEEFATTKCRHAATVRLTTTATADGQLISRNAEMSFDNGAYNHSGPSVMGYSSLVMGSLYRTDGVNVDGELVYTNKHPGGQFRGYGGPQAIFAIESQMDELAATLGIDPIELRLGNVNESGDVTNTGWKLGSARLADCLRTARDAIGWEQKKTLAGSGRGVGFAAAIHVSGANIYPGADKGSAALDLHANGRCTLRYGGADAGTWQKTIIVQFAAEQIGLPIADFDVLTMETHKTPVDLGAWSTRGTYVSGHAVTAAGRLLAERLRSLAAERLDCDADEILLEGGVAHGPTGAVSFATLACDHGVNGVLSVTEEVTLDVESLDMATGTGNISGAYSFAVQAVEVEVDADTGEVRVLDAVSVHDVGRAINPIGLESQIVGGMAMGLGAALGEELLYESGRLINPTYLNYPLPRAADLPRIRPIVLDGDDPNGPLGAKGIGEIVVVPTGAAIANAVAHATGVRIRELPLTPDRVLQHLHAARRTKARTYRLMRRPRRWWIEVVRRLYPLGMHTMMHRHGTRLARRRPTRQIISITTPGSVDAALELLGAPDSAPIAGGTDHIPARRQGLASEVHLVDVLLVPELGQLEVDGIRARLGGSVRLARLAELAGGPEERLLAAATSSIATPQIRSMATVAGNLCQQKRCWFFRNGFDCYKRGGVTCPCYAVLGDHRFYHAAIDGHRCQAVTPSDLATAFSCLDASITIASKNGRRSVPISEFFVGPGETVLRSGDLVVHIDVPIGKYTATAFEKLNQWEGDFAIVSAAVAFRMRNEVVERAAISIGALAPTPFRLHEVESGLQGRRYDEVRLVNLLEQTWTRHGHPLAMNEWKLDAATGLVKRAVARATESALRSSS